jgi:hypothetical protein
MTYRLLPLFLLVGFVGAQHGFQVSAFLLEISADNVTNCQHDGQPTYAHPGNSYYQIAIHCSPPPQLDALLARRYSKQLGFG